MNKDKLVKQNKAEAVVDELSGKGIHGSFVQSLCLEDFYTALEVFCYKKIHIG